ncbi:MAG: DUF4340 domain-containing protein [Candidatus Sericytochromatia bacterium]|nr:DUF4340 domain-containing protein [Candidatus Sericytochromatia bacterium]
MNSKVTLGVAVLVAALGTYTIMYETKPKEPEASKSPDEVQVLKFENADLKGFTVNGSDGTLTVERVKGKWENTADHKVLDTEKIDGQLRPLQELKSRRKVADKPSAADLATFGLDKPHTTVSFDWRDKKIEVKSLTMGKQNLEKNAYYAQANPSDTIYVLDAYGVDQLAGMIKKPPYATPPPPPAPAGSAPGAAPVMMPNMAPPDDGHGHP